MPLHMSWAGEVLSHEVRADPPSGENSDISDIASPEIFCFEPRSCPAGLAVMTALKGSPLEATAGGRAGSRAAVGGSGLGHCRKVDENALRPAQGLGRCASLAKLPGLRPGGSSLRPAAPQRLPCLEAFLAGETVLGLRGRAGSDPAPRACLAEAAAARAPLGEITNMATATGLAGFEPKQAKKRRPSKTPPEEDFGSPAPPVAEEQEQPDPRLASEYTVDILSSMMRREVHFVPASGYIHQQPHLSARMRSTLNDWLFEVHRKYAFRKETFFLTVNIIDRYLSMKCVSRGRLQLVGVTALLIAAKFEEIEPPELSDLVYVTANSYAKQEIIDLEMAMLTTLRFEVAGPTPAHFLRHLHALADFPEEETVRTLNVQVREDVAWYALELALLDIHMIGYLPSHIAAAALLLSRRLCRCQTAWPVVLIRLTGKMETDLELCTDELSQLLEEAPQSPLQAIRSQHLPAQVVA